MDYRAAVTYQWSNRAVIRVLAATSILFGLGILLGGPQRFDHTPALAVAATTPGGRTLWGTLALLIGGVTLAGSVGWNRRVVMYGMLAETVLFSFFTVALAMAALQQQPTSPYTDIAVYGGYAVTCAIKYVAGHGLDRADTA